MRHNSSALCFNLDSANKMWFLQFARCIPAPGSVDGLEGCDDDDDDGGVSVRLVYSFRGFVYIYFYTCILLVVHSVVCFAK